MDLGTSTTRNHIATVAHETATPKVDSILRRECDVIIQSMSVHHTTDTKDTSYGTGKSQTEIYTGAARKRSHSVFVERLNGSVWFLG